MNCLTKSQWLEYARGSCGQQVREHIAGCGVCRSRALLFSAPLQQGSPATPLCGEMDGTLRLYRDELNEAALARQLRHLGECTACRRYFALLRACDAEAEPIPAQAGFSSLLAALERMLDCTLEVLVPRLAGAAPALLGDEDALEICLELVDSSKRRLGAVYIDTREGLEENARLVPENKKARILILNMREETLHRSEKNRTQDEIVFHLERGEGPQAAIVFDHSCVFKLAGVDELVESVGRDRPGKKEGADGI